MPKQAAAERSDGPAVTPLPGPLCPRRGAQWTGRRGEPRALSSDSLHLFELSERSERCELCNAPRPRAPQVARSASGGSWAPGSPFLWLLSFGETKESDCTAGGISRPLVPVETLRWIGVRRWGLHPHTPTYFLLLRQEKVSKEKATPVPLSLRWRSGQPAVLAPWAALRNSHRSLRSLRSDKRNESDDKARGSPRSPWHCAPRQGHRGKSQSGHRCARPGARAVAALGRWMRRVRQKGAS